MTGYFEESPGNRSITRLAFWYGIIWAALFTTAFAFIKDLSFGEVVGMFTGLSSPFFALKLIQKNIENKNQ